MKILGEDLAKMRNFSDVKLNIIRPECTIADHLSSLADVHLTVSEICDAIFIYGIKLKTPLLNIELHVDEEELEIKLTPNTIGILRARQNH